MAKREHSMFNINKDLLVYKAFYFFILGGFGSVFPYLPVYFRQIGLTADQVGLIVGMRPIVQFASAPFWAIMADKYRKRKAVLVMSVLSWLVMTLALAFVEPTNEICELRITNESHTHFVNYTKVKTGFFRRSLVPSVFVLQKAGRGVIESSPDLIVVPTMNNAERSQQKIASGDNTYNVYRDLNSSRSFQLSQLKTKTRSAKNTNPNKQHEHHIETLSNTSKMNPTGRPHTEENINNKTVLSVDGSKLNGTTQSVKTEILLVHAHNGSSLSDVSNRSATNLTAKVETESLEQQTQKLRSTLEKSIPKAANKSKDTLNLVKDSGTFTHSAGDNEIKNEKGKEFLTEWEEFSDASGSGQVIDHSLEKATKTKRHDITNTIISLQNNKKPKPRSSDSSSKTRKSVPMVFDFSQPLQGAPTKNSANSSLQTIAFQSQLSETKAQNENGRILELGSGIMEKKPKNYSGNIENHETNKNQVKKMNELQPIYNFVARANMSKPTINKIKEKLKNSVFSLERESALNKYVNNVTRNVSRTRMNLKEGFNSSRHNSLPAAKIALDAALTGTDHLHEGEIERHRGGMVHHRDSEVIDVPYTALHVLTSHSGDKNRSSSSVKQFLLETTSNEQVESTEISGENSGSSEKFEDELVEETNLTAPAKSSVVSVTVLQQLKTTTTNLLKTNPNELNRIFVILMILIVVGEFLESPSFTLADAALLEHLGEERRYYGKQRLWGSLGFGIFSFIVGVLLEKSRHTVCGEAYTDYMICFCVFTLTMVLTLFTSTRFHFEYNSTTRAGSSVLSALCNVHYGSCLMAACFMGFGHGMSHNFINWFLEDLGGSKTLMGFAVICRSLADLTTFFVAGFVIKLVGQIRMMLVCLFSYGVIFTSYSLLENSWSVLPIELLNGVTYAAAWSACTSYMAGASSVDAVATIQGILQGVYWGLGSGSGAISGGLMIHHIGAVATFRFTAGGFFLGAIAFGLTQWRYNKETAERPPQTKYSYLPATPESKDTEALLSGFLTDSPISALGRKKSYKTHY